MAYESVSDCWARHGESRPQRQLPAFTSLGCYPIVYLTARNEPMCAACASRNEPSEPATHGVHWEGEPIECEGCSADIESAYGPVEESTR